MRERTRTRTLSMHFFDKARSITLVLAFLAELIHANGSKCVIYFIQKSVKTKKNTRLKLRRL